jgi:tripartite motif-containing protein 2/3
MSYLHNQIYSINIMEIYTAKLQENLTCVMCFELYNDQQHLPKVLPCQHTFCLECLNRYVQKYAGKMFPCPLCKSFFSLPDGGVRAVPSNVLATGMLDLLNDTMNVVSTADNQPKVTKDEKPGCCKHPERECTIVCMTCKTGLCTRCMKSVHRGPHAGHDLDDFEDVMDETKRKIKMETSKLTEIEKQSHQMFHTVKCNLLAWKSSQEKAVSGRVREVMTKVRQWEYEMNRKVLDLFKQGFDQFVKFREKFEEVKAASLNTSRLHQLESMNTLEAKISFDSCKQTLIMLESELKVYKSVRLVPQETLSDKLIVELGDISSKAMLAQLMTPKGMHIYYLRVHMF